MRKNFKAGALTAPLPPVLVTVGDMNDANIITIGWTGILSTVPPRTYISVRPTRHSYNLLKAKREFVINLPRASQAWEVDYAGIYTGAKVDKFRDCGFTKRDSSQVLAPTIEECPVALECRVVEIIPMGTHDVFIADIVSVSCDEAILDSEGRMCFDKADLLAYAHGEYFSLGEKVGVFGFSTKLKKGKKYVSREKKAVPVSEKSGPAPSKCAQGRVNTANRSKSGKTKGVAAAGAKDNKRAEGESGHVPYYLGVKKNQRSGGKGRK